MKVSRKDAGKEPVKAFYFCFRGGGPKQVMPRGGNGDLHQLVSGYWKSNPLRYVHSFSYVNGCNACQWDECESGFIGRRIFICPLNCPHCYIT